MVKLQVLDADYVMLDGEPLIRMFGKKENGDPVCVFYRDFYPYLYIHPERPAEEVVETVKEKFGGDLRNIENVERRLPIGYSEEEENLLKVTLNNPKNIPDLKEELKPYGTIYEADILFKYRFFADKGIRAMGWVEIEGRMTDTDTVFCPVIEAESIEPIDKLENAPMKQLSLDIECVPTDQNSFADAEEDPIVMISLIFDPAKEGQKSTVLAAKPGIDNARCFANEEEMLEELLKIIRDYDPDVLLGYNIQNYDLPYILTRLEKLGLNRKLGRADKTVFTRQRGRKQVTDILGRIVLDPYAVFKKPESRQRFKRYDLDTVASKLLGEEKIEVEHEEMWDAWMNDKSLEKYVDYCRKDAALALDISEEKRFLGKYIALSRISGITVQDCLNGGQSTRIEQLLLRELNERGYVMPLRPDSEENKKRQEERETTEYKGGLVLEPEEGLHTDGCVLVLDFKSLYPSIIRTYNICPTTLIQDEEQEELPHHHSPAGAKFVKSDVRQGVIPGILKELIEERGNVKKEMAETSGSEKAALNSKQYALKVMANSFYGYIGYIRARTYVIDVANAITAYGRKLIEETRKVSEDRGHRVVYGDTDSVMIAIDSTNLDEVYDIGTTLGDDITNSLPGQLELEFEKIFRTFLILTKKRYAGWAFEKSGDGWEEKIEMKGIETVRRDWCDLVSETMEDVIGTILKEGDINEAVETVRGQADRLKDREVDMEKLAITKGLTKSPENYDGKLPHVEVARKKAKRNPANPPKPGDRIQYVIVQGNQMLSKRAEDPEYVEEKGLRIDSDYYIDSQLIPPLERIFSVVGVDKSELLGKGRQASITEALKGGEPTRNHDVSYETNPEKAIVEELEGFTCRECQTDFRRVPLKGKCECGGDIYAYGGGMVGKAVSV